jgi:hypothetical protein
MKFKEKEELIKKIQKSLGLKVDGEDGPMTWNAIHTILNKFGVLSSNKTETEVRKEIFAEKLVALAKKEVGVEEINGTNCGPRVNEYKSATWLDSTKSWPWCAAFICWLFREAMKDGKYTFKRPQTAGAYDFENWCKEQDTHVLLKKPHGGDIKAGDVVIFNFSHIGLAISGPDESGYVTTIEGNTDGVGSREGGAVLIKKRKLSSIRSRIRVVV